MTRSTRYGRYLLNKQNSWILKFNNNNNNRRDFSQVVRDYLTTEFECFSRPTTREMARKHGEPKVARARATSSLLRGPISMSSTFLIWTWRFRILIGERLRTRRIRNLGKGQRTGDLAGTLNEPTER